MGGHTNYLVPQRTADDTTNEVGGPRASQGNSTRNLGSKHETVLALAPNGAAESACNSKHRGEISAREDGMGTNAASLKPTKQGHIQQQQ